VFCQPNDDVVTVRAEFPVRLVRSLRQFHVSSSVAPSLVLELHTVEDDVRAIGTVSAAYFSTRA